MAITFGSLFAGIGGIDLGLERAGMRCVWQVEIDDYATRVLEKHWPNVRRWRDVRTFPPRSYEFSYSWRGASEKAFAPDVKRETTQDEWRCDLICGGFPCQDISYAGKGAGLDGKRSGLWWEFARVIRMLEPRYVLVENVAALLTRGLGAVLGTMGSLGYDAEWHCIPAAAVGCTHVRERLFIIASKRLGTPDAKQMRRGPGGDSYVRAVAGVGDNWSTVETRRRGRVSSEATRVIFGPKDCIREHHTCRRAWAEMDNQPDVVRSDDGIPHRVDRLRCLGNAVVPQVAEWIGRRIVEAME